MNVGLLLPRSVVYPNIAIEFMEGIRVFLKEQGLSEEIRFKSESIGYGGSEKEVYSKAEQLLLTEGVDILVAYLDEKTFYLVKPLLAASGKLIILVNPGANSPVNWIPQPNIIHLDLHHAFCCALTGELAGRQNQARAAIASTFYDCGYLHLAMMFREYQTAGGQVRYNYVNNDPYNETFGIKPLTDFLHSEPQTRQILAVFDSAPARLFYTKLQELPDAHYSLFVSPRMLEENAMELPENGYTFSIQGYLPWHPDAPGEANRQFLNSCAQKNKMKAGLFSLLGWETGLLLQQVATAGESLLEDGEALVSALSGKIFQSPRGEIQLDPATLFFTAPLIFVTLKPGSRQPVFEFNQNKKEAWEDFSSKDVEGEVSGWTNTYLCY